MDSRPSTLKFERASKSLNGTEVYNRRAVFVAAVRAGRRQCLLPTTRPIAAVDQNHGRRPHGCGTVQSMSPNIGQGAGFHATFWFGAALCEAVWPDSPCRNLPGAARVCPKSDMAPAGLK